MNNLTSILNIGRSCVIPTFFIIFYFFETLALIYGTICSRTIFEIHAAPGAYSKHSPGAVCIKVMLLEHI